MTLKVSDSDTAGVDGTDSMDVRAEKETDGEGAGTSSGRMSAQKFRQYSSKRRGGIVAVQDGDAPNSSGISSSATTVGATRLPAPSIKTDTQSVRTKTLKQVRNTLDKSWKSLRWPIYELNGEGEEAALDLETRRVEKSLLRADGTRRKPIIDWARSFAVSFFLNIGGYTLPTGNRFERLDVVHPWRAGYGEDPRQPIGKLTTIPESTSEIQNSNIRAPQSSGSTCSSKYGSIGPAKKPAFVPPAHPSPGASIHSDEQSEGQQWTGTQWEEEQSTEEDATDSDCSQRDDSDVEDSWGRGDDIPRDIPLQVAPDQISDLRPMLLYDIRVALPKTVRNQGFTLLHRIDQDMRELQPQQLPSWIETYSLSQWYDLPLGAIESSMGSGNVVIIRDSHLNAGWKFGIASASRIRSGATPVQVQDFANKYRPSGVTHRWVSLADVVHDDYRDPQRVYNLLSAPQTSPLVPIPRQSDLDYGSLALRAREEALDSVRGSAEWKLDIDIATGLNWAIISHKHALSLGHVDTAGVHTAIVILDGVKYWAIRKTVLEGRTEIDVDDAEYFVDLAARDIRSLPGEPTDWVAVLLFPGDVLILPPNARHAVFTVLDSMMSGIHFFHYTQLQRSLCGWICSKFTTTQISNAEHDVFLSIFQAFATFWVEGFRSDSRLKLAPEDPVIRSRPHPENTSHGLSALLSVGVSIAFNDTLSGVAKPVRGKYLDNDLISFKKIWQAVARDGHVQASALNYPEGSYQTIIQKAWDPSDVWDDRWSCAGLAEILVHVARAIVHLSILWQENREPLKYPKNSTPEEIRHFQKQEHEGNWLRPDRIRARAIGDLSTALGVDLDVCAELVGSLRNCRRMRNTKFFPDAIWVVHKVGTRSGRPPSLWDALHTQAPNARKGGKGR
ncbi:unnamed protein product [Peniophora sp. CBMAI 1063]|nr:unnamed protein product [Peniophora sp. CBMAI 1063]